MQLTELKIKYKLKDSAKYEPDANCKKCKGAGEYHSAVLKQMTFCACLYFATDFRDEALSLIAKSVKTAFLPNVKVHRADS